MGRRYDAAEYARVVDRVRAAIPGVAIHADVISGFPTEDDAAFERSLAFIRALDPAGLHVFRYSGRPDTPAVRMAGQVPEADRKERAAVLLAEAAAARARFAARAAGGRRLVLFETPADPAATAAGWVGHAEDYVLVRVPAAALGPGLAGAGAGSAGGAAVSPAAGSLEGEIGVVAIDGPDPADPERALGRLVELLPRPAVAPGEPAWRR
jgi:hypothetical protein